jgi:zona occludens toxin
VAITVFTGPPGSGKSHALVKDVIVPAVLAGRRVLSNIDGLNADAIRGYCLERVEDAAQLGAVLIFHGDEALQPGFFPDEATGEAPTVVQGGDLVVFDEWALYFPKRGAWPKGCNVEPFLRWHRHLTGPNGAATDVAIGTQLPTDIHQNVRGLIVKSYKFRKLTALGAAGQYTWLLFEGHLQPKGGHYRNGTGTYDKAIFPLYASSSAAKEGMHVELKTNKKESIWNSWQAYGVLGGAPLLILLGAYLLWSAFSDGPPVEGAQSTAAARPGGQPGTSSAPTAAAPIPSPSPWRIVGFIDGEFGQRVILADEKGATRIEKPMAFTYDEGRPVSGLVDGQQVQAEDRLPVESRSGPGGAILPSLGQ